jgi:hypothetical protein
VQSRNTPVLTLLHFRWETRDPLWYSEQQDLLHDACTTVSHFAHWRVRCCCTQPKRNMLKLRTGRKRNSRALDQAHRDLKHSNSALECQPQCHRSLAARRLSSCPPSRCLPSLAACRCLDDLHSIPTTSTPNSRPPLLIGLHT